MDYKTEKIHIDKIKANPDNPRVIKDTKFKKLVKSIMDFPEMLEIRPIVVDENLMILGGNMRYRACIEAGLTQIPTIVINNLSKEQKREFVIKDNSNAGDWDWDILANEWNDLDLEDWGISIDTNNFSAFNPILDPQTNYSEITEDQIKKKAEELAKQMIKEQNTIDCICPECGNEFTINK